MSDKTNFMSLTKQNSNNRRASVSVRGFSMIEMMIVMAILTIIMGAVFKSIATTQQSSVRESNKLDQTQQAREFMDQISRDLRSAGYPNSRNMAKNSTDGAGNILTYPATSSNGVGLIKIDSGALWFAGDVDGTAANGIANVKIIRYDFVAAGNNEPNCPCIRRTEFLRNGGDPVADAGNPGAAVAQMEIQGVQNGTAADPIFTAYNPTTGTAVALPVDFTNDANTMAQINSLKVVLAVQSPYIDSTGVRPITRVVSSMSLTNCSEAIGGLTLSC
jgi:prepilin-type N-terminal cleavage/methylation domain-containing protein